MPPLRLLTANSQKALLARVLLTEPDALFLDDPTRGVDVAAREDMRRIIQSLAARGTGILLVSSELGELLQWCDRIMVLAAGRVVGTWSSADATPETIVAAATGAPRGAGRDAALA